VMAGRAIYGDEIQALRRVIETQGYELVPSKATGWASSRRTATTSIRIAR
jgi:hypothetical protein